MTDAQKAVIERVAMALCEAQQPAGAWERNPNEEYRNVFRSEAVLAMSALQPGDVLPSGFVVMIRNLTVPELINQMNKDHGPDTTP